MNKKLATLLLIASALFSQWLYWGSNSKIEQVLTSREWQTNLTTYVFSDIFSQQLEDSVSSLNKVKLLSNVRYLSNGTYIRWSLMQLFDDEGELYYGVDIQENGVWQLSDHYLLVEPKEFKNSSTSESSDFTEDQLNMIKQVFIMDSQQSRRIDIINDNSILLTSLGHGSRVLISTP